MLSKINNNKVLFSEPKSMKCPSKVRAKCGFPLHPRKYIYMLIFPNYSEYLSYKITTLPECAITLPSVMPIGITMWKKIRFFFKVDCKI